MPRTSCTRTRCCIGAQGVLPLIFGGAVFSPQVYDQDTEAFALYGHAEWRFADAWNLVSELRYTDEDKSFVGGARLGFPNGATVPFVSTDDSISFDAWSGKVGLEWSLTDDLLTYATISRGFKTGGFFGGFPTNVAQLAPFDAETLWGLELGVKSDLARRPAAPQRERVLLRSRGRPAERRRSHEPDPNQAHHEHRRRRYRRAPRPK